MSTPTTKTWLATKARDGNQCVMCRTTEHLTFQHRKATGAGGSKIRPTVEEGLVLCSPCNTAVESHRQDEAIECGWKVKWRRENCPLIPVFYPRDLAWFRLSGDSRIQITSLQAERMFEAVYG